MDKYLKIRFRKTENYLQSIVMPAVKTRATKKARVLVVQGSRTGTAP